MSTPMTDNQLTGNQLAGNQLTGNQLTGTAEHNVPDIRPEHHVHKDSEPLPGSRGAQPTVDYSAETMEHTTVSPWKDNLSSKRTKGPGVEAKSVAFNSDHPLNVQPTAQTVDNLPESKPSLTDKVIGKTEKVFGKATHNVELREKGELRESGGKQASLGQPHD